MKFLIIRFSSIGDIVLTTPVIRCIKTQLNVEVHYLTKKTFTPLIQYNPYLNKIWHIQKSVQEVIPALRKEGITHIIDLHKNLRSSWLKLALKGKYLTYNKLNFEKWLLVNFKLDRLPHKHIVERYFEALSPTGIRNDDEGLDYFIPEGEEINLGSESIDSKYICFAIGGAHATKKLTKEQISDICKNLPLQVILIGGKEDQSTGDSISYQNKNVQNWCGKTNFHGSAYLIKKCSLLITHDTGMMHIGAAFKKKIVSVWGNTVPKFGMFPYYPKSGKYLNKMIEINDLQCRPCSKIGYETCPKGHFKCIRNIVPEKVVGIAQGLLSDNFAL